MTFWKYLHKLLHLKNPKQILNIHFKWNFKGKPKTIAIEVHMEIIYSNTILIIMNYYNFSQIVGTDFISQKIQTQYNDLP